VLNTYTLDSYTWANNPAGGSWNGTSINEAEYGILGYYQNITYFYVVVDYAPQTVPTVTTQAVSNIIYSAAHYALLNGNITSSGGNTTDIRGFVYNTSSVAINPGNVAPPASGYSTNSTAYSSSIGAYTSNITGMAANTRYYVRAVAHNGIGWGYGDEVNFITIGSPTITTLTATSTSNSTSILNSQLTFDGNTTCNTTFGLSTVTHSTNFTAYTVFYTVPGTFTTGGFPAYTATSLNASTLYYYNIKVQNSFGTATGVEGTFTTTSGIAEPTNLVAIPSATTISLIWTKGVGSVYTLVRYSTGTYPTGVGIGTAVPLTTGGSTSVTGLTAGTTYYFSAWGMAAGVYSSNYTTVLCTTLAASIIIPTSNTTTTPNTSFTQTPSSTSLNNLPVAPIFVDWVSTTYNQPVNFLWYFVWIMAGVGMAVVIYKFSEGKLFVAFGWEALWLGFGASLGLLMLWIMVAFMMIAAGLAFFGDRR
jgi:hypothetical protein